MTEGRRALRILVVDDNVDSAETLAELLPLWGHEARLAHDGPQALAVAREFSPEVILLDIGLPGMDGFEVARRLREAGLRGRIVAVTGYGRDEDRRKARAAGCDDLIVKPPDMAAVQQVFERLDCP